MITLASLADIFGFSVGAIVLIIVGLIVLIVKCWRKVEQGKALVRNGAGGTRVAFSGMYVIPILHRVEIMDISIKRVEIYRHGSEGLICKDNLRADIKVVFFVRVNKTNQDVMKVAQLLGCKRASEQHALVELYDAKFSEALKTIGKRFDFVELYNEREKFREEILQIIGTDLNGYVLDDAAIDYLEQTPKEQLDPNNILDSDGIKKITGLTATQAMLANDITRNKEKTIVQQDVEAQEAILELNKQLAEAEQKQQREIAEITAREESQSKVVEAEEKNKFEKARIQMEEEVSVADENRQRQVIVAARNKERTDRVEAERVMKDQQLEATERERVVTLADIEKEKAVEVEKRNIQEVIRERVALERSVVEEEERIKDTREFATAERAKQVSITDAERDGESTIVLETKSAEASKQAAERKAEQTVIEADAHLKASEREADAKKLIADAQAAENAVVGMAAVQVMEAEAEALQKHGLAEAKVMEEKYMSEARGVESKAEAMKKLDGVGKEHEEFKLQLNKDLEVDLKQIDIRKDIAVENAKVISEALKSAKIDIVGGESVFFDKIVDAVTAGKTVDRLVDNSSVLTEVRSALLDGEGGFGEQLKSFVSQFGLSSKDVANLSVSALLMKMIIDADDEKKGVLNSMLSLAEKMGLGDTKASKLLG